MTCEFLNLYNQFPLPPVPRNPAGKSPIHAQLCPHKSVVFDLSVALSSTWNHFSCSAPSPFPLEAFTIFITLFKLSTQHGYSPAGPLPNHATPTLLQKIKVLRWKFPKFPMPTTSSMTVLAPTFPLQLQRYVCAFSSRLRPLSHDLSSYLHGKVVLLVIPCLTRSNFPSPLPLPLSWESPMWKAKQKS